MKKEFWYRHVNKFTLLVVILAIFLVSIISCTSSKKYADKHFDKAYHKDPKEVEARLNQLFPPKPPVYKQGKTVYIKSKDSSAYYKHLSDSLKQLKPTILKIHDSCGKEQNDGYNTGFDFGYKIGLFDGKQSCPAPTERIDTLFQHTSEDSLQIKSLKDSIITCAVIHEKDTNTIGKLNDKVSRKNKWIFGSIGLNILFILLAILYLYYTGKKRIV